MAITIDESSLFESLLSYALYGGAIFQLICIFAVMFAPEDESDLQQSKKEHSGNRGDRQSSNIARTQEHVSRKGKREKKKHR